MLDDLHKVEEETAAAAAVQNRRSSTVMEDKNQQLSRKEFAGFLENLEQSNVVHVPTSLTDYDAVELKNRSRRNSQIVEEVLEETQMMKKNVYKPSRPASLQHSGKFSLLRPSSVTTRAHRSVPHVCNHAQQPFICNTICKQFWYQAYYEFNH